MKEEQRLLRPYLNTLTLLCVENSSFITTLYTSLFHEIFKEVIFAKDVEEGLSIYQISEIDIIITAQVFSDMSGMDMIRKIRAEDQEVPIIFVTSFEEVDLLSEALELRVTNFVKKPFKKQDIINALESSAKQLLAKHYIKEKQIQELDMLKQKVDYADYQENLSFQKALKIIENDFYYKEVEDTRDSLTIMDFLYVPKDLISGDSYSARKVDKHRSLLFIIDGMGKGLSAGISATMTASFINKHVNIYKKLDKDLFLKKLIHKTLKYVKTILLDEEILSLSFLLIDSETVSLEYSSFSMPPILAESKHGKVEILKSNNPPISCYISKYKINKFNYKDTVKLLLYSDGLVENSIKNENETYAAYLEEDFKNSQTKEELREKIITKIDEQEDDITFILFNYIPLRTHIASLVIDSKLEETEKACEWFEDILAKKTEDEGVQSRAGLAFMEMLMNAYEHGSLGLTGKHKHRLIDSDTYFDYLAQNELTCKKKIMIDISEFKNYLIVRIKDEGDGFDTKSLTSIFGIDKKFNQRGIFMSRNATQGIYYNDIANQITFLVKLR